MNILVPQFEIMPMLEAQNDKTPVIDALFF